jgi:hypothetical protein
MNKLTFVDGVGIANVGEYFLEADVDEDDCINLQLLGIDNYWYAKASVNPDSVYELIEALQIIIRAFNITKPEESLFVYNGEVGRA